MLWLEMSREDWPGKGTWGFTNCLWSPARRQNNSGWVFWDAVKLVEIGDVVLHLRGRGAKAAFVGFSIAQSDGFETTQPPPYSGTWEETGIFYKAYLRHFTAFLDPIPLQPIFRNQEQPLREYFLRNKALEPKARKSLFYVIQAGRLQCMGGAYLSVVDLELAEILLDISKFHSWYAPRNPKQLIREVDTREQIQSLKKRVSQKSFTNLVQANYDTQCCFPGCTINERRFLIGTQIIRWGDAAELRGEMANGLCLCLLHDKAFESGLFTLDSSHQIWSHEERIAGSSWAQENISPYLGKPIRPGLIAPSPAALRHHWERVDLRSVPSAEQV